MSVCTQVCILAGKCVCVGGMHENLCSMYMRVYVCILHYICIYVYIYLSMYVHIYKVV